MSVTHSYDLVEAAKVNLRACFPEPADQKQLLSVISIAEEAHRGQTRRDSTPYIVHPLTVASAVFNKVGALGWKWIDVKIAVFAAILHDAVEDGFSYVAIRAIITNTVNIQRLVDPIMKEVDALTRRKDETYSHYMQHLISGASKSAIIIKYYDMKDNMFGCYKELYDQNSDTRQACEQLRKYLKVFPVLKEAVEKIA